jgi:transposase InsO family protein
VGALAEPNGARWTHDAAAAERDVERRERERRAEAKERRAAARLTPAEAAAAAAAAAAALTPAAALPSLRATTLQVRSEVKVCGSFPSVRKADCTYVRSRVTWLGEHSCNMNLFQKKKTVKGALTSYMPYGESYACAHVSSSAVLLRDLSHRMSRMAPRVTSSSRSDHVHDALAPTSKFYAEEVRDATRVNRKGIRGAGVRYDSPVTSSICTSCLPQQQVSSFVRFVNVTHMC